MTSFARYKPFYVSMSIRNDGNQDSPLKIYDPTTTPDNHIEAIAITQFNAAIIDKASDFLVAIERMELNSNGIPFYDAGQDLKEVITIQSKIDGSEIDTDPLLDSAYSLTHLFEILNTVSFIDPYDLSQFRCTFSISKDGFIILTLLDGQDFNKVTIKFPRRLNMILGIGTADQVQHTPSYTEVNSFYPRVDLGDDLDHIILQTNLPTNSDALGNAKLQVLTDFSVPSNYSNSLAYGANGTLVKAGFTSNIRQKIIYTPNERRYLELIGDFPIQDITIQAYYRSTDNLIKIVPLPLGGSFEIKLGFYLKQ